MFLVTLRDGFVWVIIIVNEESIREEPSKFILYILKLGHFSSSIDKFFVSKHIWE